MTAGQVVLPIPCSVVTGALGSGKTTLIRDWLKRPEMAGTALIVNEFGEVGLDHLLVSSAVETTLLMENGCLCCSLRGDLIDMILNLFASVQRDEIPPFRRILIETTGLADPVSIVRDLTATPVLKDKVRLAKVATAVDGVLGRNGLDGDPVAINQVAQADLCLITKTDLADPLVLDSLHELLTTINPLMSVHEVRGGKAPPGDLLFDTVASGNIHSEAGHVRKGGHHDHAHETHAGVASWSITLERPLPWPDLRDWFDLVYSLNAAAMLRMKGILWIQDRPRPLLVQAVGPLVTAPEWMDDWPEDRKNTRLVMITRGLAAEALERSFRKHVLHLRPPTGKNCVQSETLRV
jgi:G3E family GTPase